jgi:hypothetical protein
MKVMIRSADGTFKRIRPLWTPDRWNDGWIDNKGRFRVYRPDCPRAWSSGYALRAHVVYSLSTGVAHPDGTNLHHLNENRLDDRMVNLAVMDHGEHTIHHHSKPGIECVCKGCGQRFHVPKWRVDNGRATFCSQECYHATPPSDEHKANISRGLTRAYATARR